MHMYFHVHLGTLGIVDTCTVDFPVSVLKALDPWNGEEVCDLGTLIDAFHTIGLTQLASCIDKSNHPVLVCTIYKCVLWKLVWLSPYFDDVNWRVE